MGMPAYRVLIVDDQRDVRRVLSDGIDTLGHDIDVIAVPSGEEAILVISRHPIDLIIVDVILPGISGLELTERAQVRNPEMKIVLITGAPDPKVRGDVADAGADAFFYKPIDMSSFLEAVRECLGLVDTVPSVGEETLQSQADSEAPPQSIAERLSGLRQELQAICAVLMDDGGQIMAQAGNLPDVASEDNFISSLMVAFSAATKVSLVLGTSLPTDLLYFAGQGRDFFLTHVGQTMGLLLVVDSSAWDDEKVWGLLRSMRVAVRDLLGILTDMGISLSEQEEEQAASEMDEPEEDLEEEALPELEAIFNQKQRKKIKSEDVDAFWDSAMVDSSEQVTSGDVISYEQARQLGLAPDDE